MLPARPSMSDLEKSFREATKTENVFLFVPNIIGYARIFLALLRYDKLSQSRSSLDGVHCLAFGNWLMSNAQGHCRVLGLLKCRSNVTMFSFWFMPTNYVMAAWCYIISGTTTILVYLTPVLVFFTPVVPLYPLSV